MDELNLILQQFNTREIAIIVWLLIFTVWAFSQKSIKKSLTNVLKTLFQKKILSVIISAILYTVLIIFILAKIGIWEWVFFKDTIYWFLATAFVLLMNTSKATQEKGFFIKILKDNLKIILVLTFILNLYTFNLLVEIILAPTLVFVGVMSAFAGTKKEYLSVKKLFDFILSFIGIFFIIFALTKVFGDFQSLATSNNLKSLILSPLLTFAFIPFVYFFALIMSYENLFVRINLFTNENRQITSIAKRKILVFCHLNLWKLNKFSKDSTQQLIRLNTVSDIEKIIKEYK